MTHIAFLRALNVGRRTVKMARLVEVVNDLGYKDVWTHINSGNVVFDTSASRTKIEQAMERALEAEFGFEVTTFVRTATEVRKALAVNPFRLKPGDTYFVTFLKSTLPATKRNKLEALSNKFDTLVVKGRDVHWRMRGKSTETTVSSKAWADIVGEHRSTSRNTTMLEKLLEKVAAKA